MRRLFIVKWLFISVEEKQNDERLTERRAKSAVTMYSEKSSKRWKEKRARRGEGCAFACSAGFFLWENFLPSSSRFSLWSGREETESVPLRGETCTEGLEDCEANLKQGNAFQWEQSGVSPGWISPHAGTHSRVGKFQDPHGMRVKRWKPRKCWDFHPAKHAWSHTSLSLERQACELAYLESFASARHSYEQATRSFELLSRLFVWLPRECSEVYYWEKLPNEFIKFCNFSMRDWTFCDGTFELIANKWKNIWWLCSLMGSKKFPECNQKQGTTAGSSTLFKSKLAHGYFVNKIIIETVRTVCRWITMSSFPDFIYSLKSESTWIVIAENTPSFQLMETQTQLKT